MNKKLFLSSSFSDVAGLLAEFEENLADKRVTFIPTASKVEKVTFFVKAGKKALKKLGLIVDELDISTASTQEIADKLIKNDIIYMTGGNTFFLLQELKRTGADKLIKEEVLAGKLYLGESAGAVVTAPDIAYLQAMDSPKKAPDLENFQGLALVDFSVVPHYKSMPFKKISQQIVEEYSAKLPLKAISNKEAILVKDGQITVRRK
ncbi:peptidase [Streptococcus oricebi]|uniref:Peptidase n=2 Tax=Streptococcus oricebi TaxID=1547447 RepID=A0ABS5B3I9_9STRE|nr:Type 1 glutamine amidotransferase-like domain-containing protein [Streptococcus oricebi]MBP2623398.1 peptidase [Streptococcus oricebi]